MDVPAFNVALQTCCPRCLVCYTPRGLHGAKLTLAGQPFVFYTRADGCPICGCTTVRVNVRRRPEPSPP